jgi:hypothetical protein
MDLEGLKDAARRDREVWVHAAEQVRQFVAAHGRTPRPDAAEDPEAPLGAWYLRQQERAPFLSQSQRETLLSFLPEDWDQEHWERMLLQTHRYYAEHKEFPDYSQGELGAWVYGQRMMHYRNQLLYDRAVVLELHTCWTWENADISWHHNYELLVSHFVRVGADAPLLVRSRSAADRALIGWSSRQKLAYLKGKMPFERIRLLNLISTWKWEDD